MQWDARLHCQLNSPQALRSQPQPLPPMPDCIPMQQAGALESSSMEGGTKSQHRKGTSKLLQESLSKEPINLTGAFHHFSHYRHLKANPSIDHKPRKRFLFPQR